MAEGLLRARLAERAVEAEVGSAGLAFDGRPATPEAVAAAAEHHIDIRSHASRILRPELVDGADVVIGMERLHAREAMVLGRDARSKVFTLKELVRRAADGGARRPGEPIDAWLQRLAAGRRPIELLGASADDDVADPYRQRPEVYARCIEEISLLVDRVVALGWPDAQPAQAGVA